MAILVFCPRAHGSQLHRSEGLGDAIFGYIGPSQGPHVDAFFDIKFKLAARKKRIYLILLLQHDVFISKRSINEEAPPHDMSHAHSQSMNYSIRRTCIIARRVRITSQEPGPRLIVPLIESY